MRRAIVEQATQSVLLQLDYLGLTQEEVMESLVILAATYIRHEHIEADKDAQDLLRAFTSRIIEILNGIES